MLNKTNCINALIVACLAFLTACNSQAKPNPEGAWTLHYTPKYAGGFRVLINADSSLYRIILLNSNNKDTIKDWTTPCLSHPKTVCLSTTHLPMFEAIHALDQVVGVGFAHLVKNPLAKAAIADGRILNINNGDDISKEVMLSLQPDQFLVYSYGDKDYSSYQTLGIEVIPIAEYLEKTPLGRSEWVVLIGALSGKLNEAKTFFQNMEAEYIAIQQSIAFQKQPSVFTGYYNSGHWYAPPGNSFVAQFLQDAGARYILKDSLSDQNLVIPFEKMFVSMHSCDYWGKLSFTEDDPTANNFCSDAPQMKELPSYQTKKLFFCNTQTTDYFGDAIMQPQVILKDLIKIFHPEVDSLHVPVYFRSVEQ